MHPTVHFLFLRNKSLILFASECEAFLLIDFELEIELLDELLV